MSVDQPSITRRWIAECPRCHGDGIIGSRDCEDERPCEQCGGGGDIEVVPFITHREAVEERDDLKRRLVAEMALTRTRTEMVEELDSDYERWLTPRRSQS